MPANIPTSEQIKQCATQAGFDLCGVTTPEVIPPSAERYRKWIARGLHGEMGYLEKEPERRLNPAEVFPDVRSIIMLGLNYYQPNSKSPKGAYGRVSRYARGRDYHKVIEKLTKKMLSLLVENFNGLEIKRDFRWYVDYGPFQERAYAEKAGLGYIGKNSMLINKQYGSWIFLSEILTTLELEADQVDPESHGSCASCQRCMVHCPTGAIIAPGVVDARKCISYLTIEKRTEIEKELRQKLGDKIFGCDICQEVCPHNQRPIESDHPELGAERGVGEFLNLTEILKIENRVQFLELTSGTPLTRAKLEGLKRNASACLANQ